jgi:hypothetical protein
VLGCIDIIIIILVHTIGLLLQLVLGVEEFLIFHDLLIRLSLVHRILTTRVARLFPVILLVQKSLESGQPRLSKLVDLVLIVTQVISWHELGILGKLNESLYLLGQVLLLLALVQ